MKLKPCPFCNGEAEIQHIGNAYTKSRKTHIKCAKYSCQNKGLVVGAIHHPMSWTEEKAIELWNTRPIEDSLKSDHVSKSELRSWCEWYLTDCDCWVGDAEDEGIKNVVRNMICKVIERFCKEETGNEG